MSKSILDRENAFFAFDSVKSSFSSKLLFEAHYDSLSCRALEVWYTDKDFWQTLTTRIMQQDWSWAEPAFDYVEIYYKASEAKVSCAVTQLLPFGIRTCAVQALFGHCHSQQRAVGYFQALQAMFCIFFICAGKNDRIALKTNKVLARTVLRGVHLGGCTYRLENCRSAVLCAIWRD